MQTKQFPVKKEWAIEYKSTGGVEIKLNPEIIKKYLIRGKSELVTDQEVVFFMKLCQARGLNPFIGDVYLIKYSMDPAAIVTSIDFFRKRARSQKDCVGWETGIVVQGKDGIKYTNGLILEGEKLVGGWFKATPEGWKVEFKLEVNLAGYLRFKREKESGKKELTKFWESENQPSQIAKVAESQGLRRLWPDEFQGLATEEELLEKPMAEGAIDMTPKSFDELTMGKDVSMMDEYFGFLLQHNPGKSAEELKNDGSRDFDSFWSHFEDWRSKQAEAVPSKEEVEADLKAKKMM